MKTSILRFLASLMSVLVAQIIPSFAAQPCDRLFVEAQAHFEYGDYTGALALCDSIEKLTVPGDVSTRCRLLDHRSRAYLHINNYIGMFGDIEELFAMPKPDSLLYREAAAYVQLADFHATFQRFENASKYIDKAEETLRKYQSGSSSQFWINDIAFMIHMGRAQLHDRSNDYDTALKEITIASRHAHDNGKRTSLKSVEAQILWHIGEINRSDSIYRSIECNIDLTYDHRNSAMMSHIWLLLNSGRINDAVDVMARLRKNGVHPHILPDLYATESEIERHRGNFELAYDLLHRSVEMDDSITMAYISTVSKDAADSFEMRQMERSLDKQRHIGRRKTIVITILIGLLITAGAVTWIAVRRHHERKRAQELAEASLGNRNAELLSQAMRNDGYSQSLQVIGDILGSNHDDRAKLRRIKECLQFAGNQPLPRHIGNSSDRPADLDFIDRLQRVHPNLTNAQIRMATMVLMNLSNKDIASAQDISVNTVKCTKNMLRKKLGITEPTEEYLRRLSAASPAELDDMAQAAK